MGPQRRSNEPTRDQRHTPGAYIRPTTRTELWQVMAELTGPSTPMSAARFELENCVAEYDDTAGCEMHKRIILSGEAVAGYYELVKAAPPVDVPLHLQAEMAAHMARTNLAARDQHA